MAIKEGCKLTHTEAETLTQQHLMPRAFDWGPQGGRILVVVDQVPDRVGSIYLTEEQQDMQQAGTGWIIAVGPDAGHTYSQNTVGAVESDSPEDLLGRHIMFGMARGQAIRFSVFDSDYDSSILLMTPLDIWMIDYSKDPLNADAEFEQAFSNKMKNQEEKSAQALKDARVEFVNSIDNPVGNGSRG